MTDAVSRTSSRIQASDVFFNEDDFDAVASRASSCIQAPDVFFNEDEFDAQVRDAGEQQLREKHAKKPLAAFLRWSSLPTRAPRMERKQSGDQLAILRSVSDNPSSSSRGLALPVDTLARTRRQRHDHEVVSSQPKTERLRSFLAALPLNTPTIVRERRKAPQPINRGQSPIGEQADENRGECDADDGVVNYTSSETDGEYFGDQDGPSLETLRQRSSASRKYLGIPRSSRKNRKWFATCEAGAVAKPRAKQAMPQYRGSLSRIVAVLRPSPTQSKPHNGAVATSVDTKGTRSRARIDHAPSGKFRKKEKVMLHIYDLGHDDKIQGVNALLRVMGTGAFHAGVEVYQEEWSFGFVEKGSGVFSCAPRQCASHSYLETVDMGSTRLHKEDVKALLDNLQREWTGISYDILEQNCCHFCDLFCQQLRVGHIPTWVRSLAAAGAMLRSITGFSAGSRDGEDLTKAAVEA